MLHKSGLTLIEVMIVIAIIAIIAAIAIPGMLTAQRAANERDASASLKTLGTAEADFRSNDLDNNGVNDFWIFDVKGLYLCTGAGTTFIKLIEIAVASADLNSTTVSGNEAPAASIANYAPKGGYRYTTIATDEFGTAYSAAPGDTQHNPNEFAMQVVPTSYPSTGKLTFIINEGMTIFKRDTGNGAGTTQFPADSALPGSWSKMD